MDLRVVPPETNSAPMCGAAGWVAAIEVGIDPGAGSLPPEIRKGPVGACTTGFLASDPVVSAARVLEE